MNEKNDNPEVNKADSWYQFQNWFPEISNKLVDNVPMRSLTLEAADGTKFVYESPELKMEPALKKAKELHSDPDFEARNEKFEIEDHNGRRSSLTNTMKTVEEVEQMLIDQEIDFPRFVEALLKVNNANGIIGVGIISICQDLKRVVDYEMQKFFNDYGKIGG